MKQDTIYFVKAKMCDGNWKILAVALSKREAKESIKDFKQHSKHKRKYKITKDTVVYSYEERVV